MHEIPFRIRDPLISISTWVNLSDPTPVPFHSPLSQLVPFLDDDDHEEDNDHEEDDDHEDHGDHEDNAHEVVDIVETVFVKKMRMKINI